VHGLLFCLILVGCGAPPPQSATEFLLVRDRIACERTACCMAGLHPDCHPSPSTDAYAATVERAIADGNTRFDPAAAGRCLDWMHATYDDCGGPARAPSVCLSAIAGGASLEADGAVCSLDAACASGWCIAGACASPTALDLCR
jgi:hypothetical protein